MNQTQRKYAIERIDFLLGKKKTVARMRHTKRAVTLSPEERFRAFKKGEYTIRKDCPQVINGYTDVVKIISFKKESIRQENQAAMAKELDGLDAEAAAIRDQIMLGDGEKALELIGKYEKK